MLLGPSPPALLLRCKVQEMELGSSASSDRRGDVRRHSCRVQASHGCVGTLAPFTSRLYARCHARHFSWLCSEENRWKGLEAYPLSCFFQPQISKRGYMVDVHKSVQMVTVGITFSSPGLPIPDVMLLARPAGSHAVHARCDRDNNGRGLKSAKSLELTR